MTDPLNGTMIGAPLTVGVPLLVDFGKHKNTFYLHPDGVMVDDTITLQVRLESLARAAKRFQQVERKLSAGTMDEDEYEEATAQLKEASDKELAELERKLQAGEITPQEQQEQLNALSKQVLQAEKSLKNKKDGTPVPVEEFEKLSAELEHWRKLTQIRPVAVPYLRGCILAWDYNKDKEAEARGEYLPISTDSINTLTDDELLVLFNRVSEHYKKDEREEKKLSESLQSDSQMKKGEQGQSLNGSATTGLPSAGATA